MKHIVLALLFSLCLGGCSSTRGGVEVSDENPVERQLNRSILLDSGVNFELGGLPITLPSIGIGFKFHWRRPTIEDEVGLNLSKLGRWKGMPGLNPGSSKPKLSSPKPLGGK